jgi:hypothetical protein
MSCGCGGVREHKQQKDMNKVINGVGAAAMVSLGFIAAQNVRKRINFLNANPAIGSGALILAGMVFPQFLKGRAGKAIGVGMASAGFVGLASSFAPSAVPGITGVGYLGSGAGSSMVHSVAGRQNGSYAGGVMVQ